MSHFLVGVVIDDISDVDAEIEKILAPYDENMRVEPYIGKTKAQMIADAKRAKERIEKKIKEDSDYKIDKWDAEYLEANTDKELYRTQVYEDCEYDADGNELSTYNPKSKWDWYVIGGRWDDGDNNIVKISDYKLYDDSVGADTIALYIRAWDSFEGKSELSKEDTEALFHGFRLYNDQYYLERYGTCENYIKAMLSKIPYAFVDANGWYEKGQMGWWGFDNATQESIDSYTEFAEKYFTADENQNKYIVWVDCHI